MYKKLLLFIIITLSSFNVVESASTEMLMKMKIDSLNLDFSVMNRRPDKVLIIVRSIIRNLEFRTNHGKIIYEVEREGEWRLFLEPGSHRLTFYRYGFQEATTLFNRSNPNEVWMIKVTPIDDEPPIIDHIPLRRTLIGDTLNFSALVTDNFRVGKVILFYRFGSVKSYMKTGGI